MLDAELLTRLKRYNRGFKILCVDDEDMLREFLFSILKNHFDYVDVARNGSEALELYQAVHHDLVLTDIKMPVMDGLELVRNIREISADQTILVFSAYQEANELIELINCSVNHFLIKPFSIVSLIKKLTEMCEALYNRQELRRHQARLEKLVEDKTLKIRRQKEQIQKKSDFLQEIIDALQLPFLVGEIQHAKIIHANKEAQSVLIPPGSSRFDYFFDQQMLQELQEFKATIVKEKALETEKNGLRLYTAYNFPILEESGSIKQIIQYLVDITDLTRNLISTQSNEARLRFELNSERTICDLAKTANQSATLESGISQLLFILSHSLGLATTAVYKLDKSKEHLTLLTSSSTETSTIRLKERIELSSVSEQLQTEIKQGSRIMHSDLSVLQNCDRQLFESMNIQALLLMPVFLGSEICGITALLHPEEHFWNYKYFNQYATVNGIISALWARSI